MWAKTLLFAFYLTFSHTITTFNDPTEEHQGKIAGKGENAGYQHFLLFPQYFLSFPEQISVFQSHLLCRLLMLSIRISLIIMFVFVSLHHRSTLIKPFLPKHESNMDFFNTTCICYILVKR